MRQETHFSSRPDPLEITKSGNGQAIVRFRLNITDCTTDPETPDFMAEEYSLTLPDSTTLADRIRANWELYTMWAVGADEEQMAAIVRERRNRLLRESDAVVALDRLGLPIPETITSFTSVKAVFEALRNATAGPWAQYRQALRDIPQQPGFPYEVEFPTPPSDTE